MEIKIEIRVSVSHHESWDMKIDDFGWEKGLTRECLEMEIQRHVVSTMDMLETSNATLSNEEVE